MDSNTCLEWWRSADTAAERREYRGALRSWLMHGGFEPDWTARERAALMRGFVRVTRADGAYWYWGRVVVPD